MPGPINDRLARLRTRRRGTDRLDRVAMDARQDLLAKSEPAESYQARALNQPYTRYAFGAMQEVGPDYTKISIATAERVGRQLEDGLGSLGQKVEFRLQGSVPLNVHIRGVSDVDLLTLGRDFLVYATYGRMSQSGHYRSPTAKTSIGVLQALRRDAEKVLKARYPAADVDTSGGKAINISGGSLQRPVDVVPSHWYDTADYQASGAEHDRAITILDKKQMKTIDNWPFLQIKLVHERDVALRGGLKMAIRLCKNVKADALDEGKSINLPSFDIAAAMFHADQNALGLACIHELAALAETQRFLDYLTTNEAYAKKLRTPDGSRLIFDKEEKLASLRLLSVEMDDLARQVAKEQCYLLRIQERPSLADSREALIKSFIPG